MQSLGYDEDEDEKFDEFEFIESLKQILYESRNDMTGKPDTDLK